MDEAAGIGEMPQESIGTLTAHDPSQEPAPEGWLRRFRHWFLFWPIVVYVAARVVTLAVLAATAPINHHTCTSGSSAGTAIGSCAPRNRVGRATCR